MIFRFIARKGTSMLVTLDRYVRVVLLPKTLILQFRTRKGRKEPSARSVNSSRLRNVQKTQRKKERWDKENRRITQMTCIKGRSHIRALWIWFIRAPSWIYTGIWEKKRSSTRKRTTLFIIIFSSLYLPGLFSLCYLIHFTPFWLSPQKLRFTKLNSNSEQA